MVNARRKKNAQGSKQEYKIRLYAGIMSDVVGAGGSSGGGCN